MGMQTAHIVRCKKPGAKRFQVWRDQDKLFETDVLTEARKYAQGTDAAELVECWETGKLFERTKRGAWRRLAV